ncbi:MAG: hypothetical protein HRT82_10480 [Henriciella sp.]|nr:hypothetical protein [Henriciella sp.]
MVRTLLRFLAISAAGLTLMAATSQAHEQAVGYTELTVKTGAGASCVEGPCRLEIAHRLSIHDAESTLMSVLGARADLVGDAEAQVKFANYVASQFVIANAMTGETVPLTLLGGEVERGYYWVYQEGLIPAGVAEITIRQSVLMDAIPRQTNRVNVKAQSDVETLIFTAASGPKDYKLP